MLSTERACTQQFCVKCFCACVHFFEGSQELLCCCLRAHPMLSTDRACTHQFCVNKGFCGCWQIISTITRAPLLLFESTTIAVSCEGLHTAILCIVLPCVCAYLFKSRVVRSYVQSLRIQDFGGCRVQSGVVGLTLARTCLVDTATAVPRGSMKHMALVFW